MERPGGPVQLIAGREITRSHYELIADRQTGITVGETMRLGRYDFTVVGMTSGAVHDAMQLAEVASIAMIFVRSQGGISHSPAEYTTAEDAAAGAEVLARALHHLGYGA